MSDGPAERPVLKVLMMRAEWEREGNLANMMNHPHSFVLVDILQVEDYQAMKYRVVALDPESELAWHLWRKRNPEAA